MTFILTCSLSLPPLRRARLITTLAHLVLESLGLELLMDEGRSTRSGARPTEPAVDSRGRQLRSPTVFTILAAINGARMEMGSTTPSLRRVPTMQVTVPVDRVTTARPLREMALALTSASNAECCACTPVASISVMQRGKETRKMDA